MYEECSVNKNWACVQKTMAKILTQNIDYTRHVYGCGADLQLTPTLKQVRFTNSSFGLDVMFHLLPSGTPDALLTELYSSDLLTGEKIPIMQDPTLYDRSNSEWAFSCDVQ